MATVPWAINITPCPRIKPKGTAMSPNDSRFRIQVKIETEKPKKLTESRVTSWPSAFKIELEIRLALATTAEGMRRSKSF
jgi:hypothetical protein